MTRTFLGRITRFARDLLLPKPAGPSRDTCHSRLLCEPLEDRRLLSVFTVNNPSDGAVTAAGQHPGSLRQAKGFLWKLTAPASFATSAVKNLPCAKRPVFREPGAQKRNSRYQLIVGNVLV
jgi:hypothetical protein